MKKCPFCAEEIQDEAVKCRYCGEFLDGSVRGGSREKGKWYYSTATLVIGLILVGPLALPLLWRNPRYKLVTKVVVTVIVVAITVGICYSSVLLYEQLLKTFENLGI